MRVAYIRVSTADQNEDRQREGLKKYNIEKEFFEKVSAKNTDRKELKAMMDFVREGDTVYIHDFSRLAIVETLNEKGVHLVSNKENVDTSTPTGKLMLTMIGAIAEFERDNLLERQKEGIEIAKRKGKYKGRKPVEVDDDAFDKEYQDYMARRISKSQMARNLEISRPTLERIMREKGLLENK